ncbi:MAG TPA: ABC transporter ATP-binding protein [Planctomycetota bacterium]|nr:ABC transporter ATP-binding protein [Planctomycetota bacterium]
MLFFWPYIRPDWAWLSLSFFGLAIQAAFSVLIAMVPAILERNWSAALRDRLFFAIGGLLVVNLIVLMVQVGVNWLMTRVTENVVRRVKLAIFKKVGSLPSEEMSFQVVGKFAQRTTGDVMRLGGIVSPGVPMAVFAALQLIFMLCALFWLDARFAWTLPVVVVTIWFVLRRINERVRFWARKDQLEHERLLTQFIESIGGVRDLVASGRFDKSAEEYERELIKKQRFLILSAWWNNLAGMVPTAIFSMLIFGYYLSRIAMTNFNGQGEVGTILAYGGNLLMAQGLVLSVFKLATDFELSAPSLFELKRLLEAPEVSDPGVSAAIASGEVVFDRVTFAYGAFRSHFSSRRLRVPKASRTEALKAAFASLSGSSSPAHEPRPQGSGPAVPSNGASAKSNGAKTNGTQAVETETAVKPVLDNVTFRIRPGTFAAIVGQSGSGKTTLFYLLLRLLEPIAGDILLGGLSLGEIPLKLLRDYVGFIPQAPFIFSGTIRQNLLMGANDGEISDERIQYAVEMAKLGALISKRRKDGGLDAPVGAGGASLSAGERQRIALARVFLRNPGIVVCDEYTANIDIATAKLIHSALKNEFAGKTRIVITHQLYTVRGADCIFVLDEGRIVDQGRHDDLLNKEGLYREMWDVQRLG